MCLLKSTVKKKYYWFLNKINFMTNTMSKVYHAIHTHTHTHTHTHMNLLLISFQKKFNHTYNMIVVAWWLKANFVQSFQSFHSMTVMFWISDVGAVQQFAWVEKIKKGGGTFRRDWGIVLTSRSWVGDGQLDYVLMKEVEQGNVAAVVGWMSPEGLCGCPINWPNLVVNAIKKL